MSASVAVRSNDQKWPDEVCVTQTGPNTATLAINEWNIGDDVTNAPASARSYDLSNVAAKNGQITAETRVLFETIDVTITLSRSGALPGVIIDYSGWMVATQTISLPLTDQDRGAIAAFLAASQFPEPTT